MNIRLNPVLDRELRERARSKRTIVTLFVYLAALAGGLQLLYTARRRGANVDPWQIQQASSALTGRLLFDMLLFGVIVLSFLIVPGLTAAGIAGERDRQTLVPLQVTLLRPRSILFGKLLASLAFVTLLLVALAPLLGATLILGGVNASAILKGLGMTLLIALTFGSLSLMASTLTRRVQTAFVLSLVIVFALSIGTLIAYALQQALIERNSDGTRNARDNRAVLVFNPLVATADALRDSGSFAAGVVSPFRPLQEMVRRDQNFGGVFAQRGGVVAVATTVAGPGVVVVDGGSGVVGVDGGPGGQLGGGAAARHGGVFATPMWARSVVVYLVITVLSLLVAIRRLRTPTKAGDR